MKPGEFIGRCSCGATVRARAATGLLDRDPTLATLAVIHALPAATHEHAERAEIADLQRQVAELRALAAGQHETQNVSRPSPETGPGRKGDGGVGTP